VKEEIKDLRTKEQPVFEFGYQPLGVTVERILCKRNESNLPNLFPEIAEGTEWDSSRFVLCLARSRGTAPTGGWGDSPSSI
jgi:hypothetical protein